MKKDGKGISQEDYTVRKFTVSEWLKYTAVFLAGDAVLAGLFFHSVIAWAAGLVFLPLYIRLQKRKLIRERAAGMREEFLTGAQLVLTAMQAGYAAENAFREALPELKKVYSQQDFIVTEFSRITAGTSLNIPLEKLLLNLAERSGVEDIERFAEVFVTARRSGGDLTAILRNTILVIQEKEETRREIATILAGREMEQTMMSVIPLGILAYVSLASPGFLSPMYHTTAGLLVMAAALGLYAAGWLWGRKIVRIEI